MVYTSGCCTCIQQRTAAAATGSDLLRLRSTATCFCAPSVPGWSKHAHCAKGAFASSMERKDAFGEAMQAQQLCIPVHRCVMQPV